MEQEALDGAVETSVEGVKTRVMAAEHLVAIALRTGRAKDYARIIQFLELDTLNIHRLNDILARHGLTTKWRQFKRKYLEQNA